jgi:hypothetical protein
MEHAKSKGNQSDSARSFSNSQFMKFAKEQARRETLTRDYEASAETVQHVEDPAAKELQVRLILGRSLR